jgi:hypothetical protein
MRYLTLLLTLLTLVGCSGGCRATHKKDIYVTFTFGNASTNKLNGVKIECAGKSLGAGILVKGGDATIFDVRWPDAATGKVNFIEYDTEQHYSIDVSLAEVGERIRAGECRQVTLRILSYEKAEMVCE